VLRARTQYFAHVERGCDPLDTTPRVGPAPVSRGFKPDEYHGRVVALTEKAVTIKLEGNLQIEVVSFHPDGTIKEKKVYTQDNNQASLTFPFAPQLLPRPNGIEHVQRGHKVSEIQIGDVIQIRSSQWQGADHCTEIKIYRRPAGRVPPTVGDKWLMELGKKLVKTSTGIGGYCRKHGARARGKKSLVFSSTYSRHFHP